MKFIIVTLAIAITGAAVQLLLPWWSLAFVAFIIGYLANLNIWASLGAGLLGSSGVWFFYALWLNHANESLLASKLGPMLFVPYPLLLVVVSATIAGLLGAFATAGGRNLRQLLA